MCSYMLTRFVCACFIGSYKGFIFSVIKYFIQRICRFYSCFMHQKEYIFTKVLYVKIAYLCAYLHIYKFIEFYMCERIYKGMK